MAAFTTRLSVLTLLSVLFSLPVVAQSVETGGGYGSIATPRPINPATGTTNPSARATQTLNPYLGSTPDGSVVQGELKLRLDDVVTRGPPVQPRADRKPTGKRERQCAAGASPGSSSAADIGRYPAGLSAIELQGIGDQTTFPNWITVASNERWIRVLRCPNRCAIFRVQC